MANYSLVTYLALFSLIVSSFCRNLLHASKPYDAIDDLDWINATATTYGVAYGAGGPGVCQIDQDVVQWEPYNSLTAAVADPLFTGSLFPNNTGCKACYQIRCSSLHCSGKPVVVSAIDYLNNEIRRDGYLFDLSGCSIAALAIPGEEDQLRSSLGFLEVQYKRCNLEYVEVIFNVGLNSTNTYLETSVECQNGADIVALNVRQTNSSEWTEMAPMGAYFTVQFNGSYKMPLSFKMQTNNSHIVVVTDAIPQDYTPNVPYGHRTVWSPLSVSSASLAACHK